MRGHRRHADRRRATPSTSRTRRAACTRSTRATGRAALGASLPRARTTAATASPTARGACTAAPTRPPSRCRRRPAGCSGSDGLVTPDRAVRRHRAAGREQPRLHRAPSATRPADAGALYALDAHDGSVRWTLLDDSRALARTRPSQAAAAPGTRRRSTAAGNLYWGIANPYPLGGTARAAERRAPTPGRRSTPTRWSSSTGRPGALLWYDQVTRARRSRLRLPAAADPRARRGGRDASGRRLRRRARRGS